MLDFDDIKRITWENMRKIRARIRRAYKINDKRGKDHLKPQKPQDCYTVTPQYEINSKSSGHIIDNINEYFGIETITQRQIDYLTDKLNKNKDVLEFIESI